MLKQIWQGCGHSGENEATAPPTTRSILLRADRTAHQRLIPSTGLAISLETFPLRQSASDSPPKIVPQHQKKNFPPALYPRGQNRDPYQSL